MNWRRLNGEIISQPILQAVEATILAEQAMGNRIKICIGTDSQVKADEIDFASVIVFLREKKGGFMFIHNRRLRRVMGIKERMITEVSYSVEIAYQLCDLLDQHDVELEVHADINTDPYFESNVALKEAMGYIRSMGFEVKMKPYAFASSSCADKVV
jgi:predicted RNase H-related nuclease YkuK (DUF458 family)